MLLGDEANNLVACASPAVRAERRAEITVFPGMEVSCKTDPGHGSRIHCLVAFPPGTMPDVIGAPLPQDIRLE